MGLADRVVENQSKCTETTVSDLSKGWSGKAAGMPAECLNINGIAFASPQVLRDRYKNHKANCCLWSLVLAKLLQLNRSYNHALSLIGLVGTCGVHHIVGPNTRQHQWQTSVLHAAFFHLGPTWNCVLGALRLGLMGSLDDGEEPWGIHNSKLITWAMTIDKPFNFMKKAYFIGRKKK